MILEYHRPKSLEEALALLQRSHPPTYPLGGGIVLSRVKDMDCAVVDLQDLGLNQIVAQGNVIRIGATASLQQLVESSLVPDDLALAARKETTYNLRQRASVAGSLVSGDGRSPFLAAMLALDVTLVWLPGEKTQPLGDFLALRGKRPNPGHLIVEVRLTGNARLKYEAVARTPEDRPIVLVAVARWPSGRTRVVVGGFGEAPQLILDGPDGVGAPEAMRLALAEADDPWASAVYRQEVAPILFKRCMGALMNG